MTDQNKDQTFVEYVVKSIVDHPEEVRVERKVDEMGVLLTLYVQQEDMRQVIGRNGNTARSLRTLLRVVGARNNARVNLKIYEPDDIRRARMESGASHAPEAAAHTGNEDALDFSMDDLKL